MFLYCFFAFMVFDDLISSVVWKNAEKEVIGSKTPLTNVRHIKVIRPQTMIFCFL